MGKGSTASVQSFDFIPVGTRLFICNIIQCRKRQEAIVLINNDLSIEDRSTVSGSIVCDRYCPVANGIHIIKNIQSLQRSEPTYFYWSYKGARILKCSM